MRIKKINFIFKLCVYFSFVLTNNLIWSQNEINHIEYEIKLNVNENNKASFYDALISNLELKLEQTKFDLFFNNNISKFSKRESSISQEDNSVIMDISDMLGNEYYKKSNCDSVFVKYEKVSKYKDFTCYSIVKTEWLITNEIKIIGDYECHKAYATIEKDYGDGEKSKLYDIIAWYCPKLPYQFGPKGFGNLPGIILELEQPFVIFRAKKINYLTQSNNLLIPTKNIVSESSLYE